MLAAATTSHSGKPFLMPRGVILIVEDHPDTNLSLQWLLRREGYDVLSATNVKQGLEMAEANAIDLLISDIGLPDGTGWEMMQSIRESKPMKAIALSGFGTEDDKRRSKEAGFLEHLTKPYNIPELKTTVEKLLVSSDA
jgi:DNA-binding response OmpR family regulator